MKCVSERERKPSGRFARSALGAACLAVASVTTLLLCIGLAAGRAQAEIEQTLLQFGSDLIRVPMPKDDGWREFHINGARFWLRAESVQEPFPTVFRRYQNRCAEANVRLFQALGAAVQGLVGRTAKLLGSIATSSVRRSGRGYVACVDFDGHGGELLLQRLGTLPVGDDLQSLGSLHYVYLERDTSGPQQDTLVLSLRAGVASSIDGFMSPGDGDAAGSDIPGFPRPEGMQRILSAWEIDGPSGVFSYVTKSHSPAQIEAFYRKTLPERGWRVLERHRNESLRIDQIRLLSVQKSQRLITVITHPAETAQTILTLLASEPG